MKNLLEIDGKWRVVGDEKKATAKPGSSSWSIGYVRLVRPKDVASSKWILCDTKYRDRSRQLQGGLGSKVQLLPLKEGWRLKIKTSNGYEAFIIIPSNQNDVESLEKKVVSTISTLQDGTPEKRDDKLSAEDALETLFTDDEDEEKKPVKRVKVEDTRADNFIAWEEKLDKWRSVNTQLTPIRHGSVSDDTTSSAHITRSENTNFYTSKRKESIFSRGHFSTGMKTYKHSRVDTTPKLSQASSMSGVHVYKAKKPPLMPNPSSNLNKTISTKLDTSRDFIDLNSDDDEPLVKVKPLQGFSNLGNTCYMNVVLQSLLSLDLFTADLIHCYKKYEDRLNDTSLLRCLATLALCKRAPKPGSKEEQTDLVRRVRKAVTEKTSRYNDHRQHDAHEFFCEILDILKEEIISLDKEDTTSGNTSEANVSTTPNQATVNATVDNFQFELGTKLVCTGCQRRTDISETHNGLTVSIPEVYLQINNDDTRKRQIDTYIQDMIDAYFQSETVEFCCESCGCKKASATQSFKSLPRVLVVVAKRFDNLRFNVKMEQKLGISRHITLSDHCDSEMQLAQPPNHPVELWTIPNNSRPDTAAKPLISSSQHVSIGVKRRSLSPLKGNMLLTSADRTKVKKRLVLPTNDQENRILSPEKRSESPDLFYPADSPVKQNQTATDIITSSGNSSEIQGTPRTGLFTTISENKPRSREKPKFNFKSTIKKEKEPLIPISGNTPTKSRQTLISEYKTDFKFEDSDDDLLKAIELSKQQQRSDTQKRKDTTVADTDMLSEDEQMRLAIEQSLMDVGRVPSPQPSPLKESLQPGQIHDTTLAASRSDQHRPPHVITSTQGLRGGCREGLGAAPQRLNDSLVISCDDDSDNAEVYNDSQDHTDQTKVEKGLKNTAAFLISSDEDDDVASSPDESYKSPMAAAKRKTPPKRDCNGTSLVQAKLTSPRLQWAGDRKRRRVIRTPTKEIDSANSSNQITPTKISFNAEGIIQVNKCETIIRSTIKSEGKATPNKSPNKSPMERLPSEPLKDDDDYDHVVPSAPSSLTESKDSVVGVEISSPDDKDKENVRPPDLLIETQSEKPSVHRAKLFRSPAQLLKIKKHAEAGTEFGYSYGLVGIINHLGSSSSHGHYVNDVYNIKDDTWLSYDDSYVKVTDISSLCAKRNRSGYIFFYADRMVLDDLKHQ